MSDTPLLQLQNITKTFGSVQALDDVDFEVRAGEVMALVGDNGAGKSTLVLPVKWITKNNYTQLFTQHWLKKSEVCVGQYKKYCN